MDQKFITPLSIISIFFSFTEIIAGYAVTSTSGTIQIILTFFVVVYPTIVAFCFFAILWLDPSKFYAPTDFKTDEAYLKMQERRVNPSTTNIEIVIKERILEYLTSTNFLNVIRGIGTDEKDDVLKEKMEDAAKNISDRIIDSNFFTVEVRSRPDLKNTYSIDTFPDFETLTDTLYYWLQGNGVYVRAFYYGTDWILIDIENNNPIPNQRMISNVPCGNRFWDKRSLSEVGINPGSTIQIKLLNYRVS